MKMQKFNFARADLIIPMKNKLEVFDKVFMRSRMVYHKDGEKFGWLYKDMELIEHQELGLLYHGYLSKFRIDGELERFDEKTYDIIHERFENLVEAKARFILILKHGILVYHPHSQHIQDKQFVRKFIYLFTHRIPDSVGYIEVFPLLEQNDIGSMINKYSSEGYIKKLEVVLVPSNPSSRDIWQPIQDDLVEQKIVKHKTVVKSEEGLRLKINSHLYRELAMAEDGYGKARFEGENRDGTSFSWNSGEKQIEQKGPTDDSTIQKILESFKDMIKRLIRRLDKK